MAIECGQVKKPTFHNIKSADQLTYVLFNRPHYDSYSRHEAV
jgi:hypothetical protein